MLHKRQSTVPRIQLKESTSYLKNNIMEKLPQMNFKIVSQLQLSPRQKQGNVLGAAVLLPPQSTITFIRNNFLATSPNSALQENKQTDDSTARSSCGHLLRSSPKKQLLEHNSIPEETFQKVKGPVTTLKSLFGNVVTVLKHVFTRKSAPLNSTKDQEHKRETLHNNSTAASMMKSKEEPRCPSVSCSSPVAEKCQSLESIGPDQESPLHEIFPGSSTSVIWSPALLDRLSTPCFQEQDSWQPLKRPQLKKYSCPSQEIREAVQESLQGPSPAPSSCEGDSRLSGCGSPPSSTSPGLPNITTGHASASEEQAQSQPSVGPPCPPPPPPPPPPPGFASNKLIRPTTTCAAPEPRSITILRDMQQRLRSRMRKQRRDVQVDTSGTQNQSERSDLKFKQWIEIQAHKMKIKPKEMKQLVKQKQHDFCELLKTLKTTVFETPQQVTTFVESYQDGLTWFPGGTKEVKTSDLNIGALESQVEVMTEYVQVMNDMSTVLSQQSNPAPVFSPTVRTLRILGEYRRKDKLWGPVLLSQGKVWKDHNLPFDESYVNIGANHMINLARSLALSIATEADKIHGVHVSFGCARTTKVKSFLLQTLDVVLDCVKYAQHSTSESASLLQHCASNLAGCHLRISCSQYEGFVHKSDQQCVCSHFEQIIKALSKTKEIIKQCNGPVNVSNGYVQLLPSSENLAEQINNSCNLLLKHVQLAVNKTQSVLEDESSVENNSAHLYKEMISLMIFSCKYAERSVEMLGSSRDEDNTGLQDLLQGLQALEGTLGSS